MEATQALALTLAADVPELAQPNLRCSSAHLESLRDVPDQLRRRSPSVGVADEFGDPRPRHQEAAGEVLLGPVPRRVRLPVGRRLEDGHRHHRLIEEVVPELVRLREALPQRALA